MHSFCMLAAGSSWNEPALKATFRHGLNNKILTETASCDMSLDSLIYLVSFTRQFPKKETNTTHQAFAF